MDYQNFLISYVIGSSLFAVILTVYDKAAAKLRQRRVPERCLLCVAALSGCVAMYLTMRLIHHKTRKHKFMIGIPVIFLAECVVGITAYLLLTENNFFGLMK